MKTENLKSSLVAKTIAFFLLVLAVAIVLVSSLGAFFLYEEEFYTKTPEQIKNEMFVGMAWSDSRTVLYHFLEGEEAVARNMYESTNFNYVIFDEEGNKIVDGSKPAAGDWSFSFEFDKSEFGAWNLVEGDIESVQDGVYTVQAYIDGELTATDRYAMYGKLTDFAHSMRYAVYFIAFLALIVALACFIFLLSAAGHKKNHEGIYAGGMTKVPFDLLVAAVGLVLFVILFVGVDVANIWMYHDLIQVITGVLFSIVCFVAIMGLIMQFAVRVKLGSWWENTLIYKALVLAWRVVKAVFRGIGVFFRNLPLIWKSVLIILIIAALELIFMEAFYYDTSRIMLLWALSRLVIIPALIYLALVMRKLQKAGENLSEGDLSYQVDTKHMIGDFKKHGEDLNRIGEGMAKAVEDRLKSERLKTDLITNVSHDLKTPLTSIVNYAELIGREKTENKKIVEYSEVLLRQSERLNSLIENLVEASKVSSGNIDVYLAPAEVNVLLGQAVGEYEQKLIDGELELIVKQPETPVKIMADGRLLWRVFDNLMNNIVKYAQAGTRVYLTVERIGERALISFKNTSRYALDISPEELLERFVRNDESRSSEGNGLGLSIAQSLTELQGGSLELFVDGDLFKATLEFPTIG